MFQFFIYSPTPLVCAVCSVCVETRGHFTEPGPSFHDVGPGLEVRSSGLPSGNTALSESRDPALAECN